MPLANEHAARQVPPGTFERSSFKRKVVTNGVTVISGRVKGSEATSVQSVRFDATKFTLQRARKWLRDNGFKADALVAATGAPAKDDTDTAEETKLDSDMVFRFDRAELPSDARKYRLDSQGFMHVGATFTTVGVYKYRDRNGNIRSEFRPASEVQSPRFIDSLKRCVVTNEHPPGARPVTIKNVKQYQVGHTGDAITKNGLKVDGGITLTEIQSIQDVHTGAKRGISVGYRCRTRYNPGVWDSPNGPIPYDYVQDGHVANHICITSAPRGGLGRDGTSMHLDSLEAEQVTETKEEEIMNTVSLTIDGLALPLPSEAAPIVKAALDKRDSELSSKDDSVKEFVTKVADLETQIETLTTERDQLKVDSEKRANVGSLVKSRLELLQKATGLLEDGALDKMDSESDDYEDSVIDAVLVAHGVDLEEAKKLYTDSTHLDIYKRTRFEGIAAAKGDDAHKQLSAGVVNSPLARRDSTKEPEYRKGIRERLKIAQNRRDGTHREEKTA